MKIQIWNSRLNEVQHCLYQSRVPKSVFSQWFSQLQMALSPCSEGVERSYGTCKSPETSMYDGRITFRTLEQNSFEGKQKFQFFCSIYPFWFLYGTNFRNPLCTVSRLLAGMKSYLETQRHSKSISC